jgi:hypothetical protein
MNRRELAMNTATVTEEGPEITQRDGVCFCRICGGLLFCYLVCLAAPLVLLIGVVAAVLAAIFA